MLADGGTACNPSLLKYRRGELHLRATEGQKLNVGAAAAPQPPQPPLVSCCLDQQLLYVEPG